MYVYVDESGDPGLKLGKGSTPFFTIALVVINDEEMAESLNQRITLLRKEINFHPNQEFKFSKCSEHIRKVFLTAIAPYDFFYYGICINKGKLWGEGLKIKESFYKYSAQLAFQNAKAVLDRATVFLDGCGERVFRQQLQTYIKRNINQTDKNRIAQVKIVDSHNNNLIQVADMVAGAINRSLSTKHDRTDYRRIISHREMYVQFWPK